MAALAAEALRRWWRQAGGLAYPGATELLLHADGGGGDGSHGRLWQASLRRLAADTGLSVTVCHLPPGTSKWTAVELSTLYHVRLTKGGGPPQDHEVQVHVIGNPATARARE
jgi:hypothetical protein